MSVAQWKLKNGNLIIVNDPPEEATRYQVPIINHGARDR